ncbi:MAG: hypothetical protein ACI9KE_004979 [Polyangiales bacterium]|jgi:hypothetical protein
MRLLTADFEIPSAGPAAENPRFSTTATNTGIAPNINIFIITPTVDLCSTVMFLKTGLSVNGKQIRHDPWLDYRLGTDELLLDSEGTSRISMVDLAVALLDEAERPKHHRMRFTAAY